MKIHLLVYAFAFATSLSTPGLADVINSKTQLPLGISSDVECRKLVDTFPKCNLSIGCDSFASNRKENAHQQGGNMSNRNVYGLEIASFSLGVLLTMVAISIKFSLPQEEIEELGHHKNSLT